MQAGPLSNPRALVSVVIPCYNPTRFLNEALASVRAQSYEPVEIIVVDDGTDKPEARELLRSVVPQVTHFIEQPNRGPGAARNAGFRAASGSYVVPLDADDKLAPSFIAECVKALQAHPEAAFAHTDYRVFGDIAYVERLHDYNLYHLLDQNTLIYCSLIRRADWESADGYDESSQVVGYEDWDFWLRLGERGRFGYHLPRVLFSYRKSSGSLFTQARKRHPELVEVIRANHAHLYSRECRAQIKARWFPAVCVLNRELETSQTIDDLQCVTSTDTHLALKQSAADAFLVPPTGKNVDPHSAEFCALAVWGGNAVTKLPDGSLFVSRSALASARNVDELSQKTRSRALAASQHKAWPGQLEQIHRHLANAELTSLDTWLRHPARSVGRLVPLRVKERVNRAVGRPIFDLSFYLTFQPQSVFTDGALIPPLRYMPRQPERRRIALITPHLGPGGAENVLLEVAGAIDRQQCELFLIATQSQDSRWLGRWEQMTDHVYDLAALVSPDRMVAALYSITTNWEFDACVIQNSLAAYSAIPLLRGDRPRLRIIDLIHAVHPEWDFVSSTAPVASQIDLRLAISESARQRLLQAGTPREKIRLIRNGIDLERFRPVPVRPAEAPKNILFAGRLDPVKRPLLLVDIAAELVKLRAHRDFRVLVGGDGAEGESLRARLRKTGLESLFTLMGQVDDVPALLADADVVVVPSQAEGIPLIVLEAFAAARPVICSRVGAVEEVVDSSTGVLIDLGPGEAAQFAAAIERLLGNSQLRQEMGRAGRRKVEAEYNRERSRAAYRDLFWT
jgi:glycosyltransferase involved in cell wall biosynthesis/GT2 family glycosyltransferase